MGKKIIHRLLSVVLMVEMVFLSTLPGPTTVRSVWAEEPGTALYRTTVRVRTAADWARLEKLDVVVLEEITADGQENADKESGKSASSRESAVILADEDQLEALARLRFEPQSTDELGLLVNAQGQEKGWLRASLRPLLERGAALQALKAQASAAEQATAAAVDAARAELRAAMHALTAEQQAGLSSLSSVDDDADGLTNTQEQWWCTDPLDEDTDNDGKSDGNEIKTLKAWMRNERSGPPYETPWPDWPPQRANCPDKDSDSIPNLAERWELGLSMDLESTDRDKFDDGQELFGVTYCPGGDLSCNYGDLPRSADSGYVGADMPSWVKSPGNHPLVAAYPMPEIDVVESSLHVEAVTEIKNEHTITSGTERSYSTAKTEGTSTSVADTVTWNDWQEVSRTDPIANALTVQPEFVRLTGRPEADRYLIKSTGSLLSMVGGLAGLATCPATLGLTCVLGLASFTGGVLSFVDTQLEAMDQIQDRAKPNEKDSDTNPAEGIEPPTEQEQVDRQGTTAVNQDASQGGGGTRITTDGTSQVSVQNFYPVAYPVQRPTVTVSSGRSWGGAQTNTHTQYEEHTITNAEAFLDQESWSHAIAINTAHAADLWFTYNVRNTGTEYAREVTHLAFNIYIGDDPNPACTYFVGSSECGVPVDAVLFTNFMPDEEHTYTSFRIPLTLEQMKAIDLGSPVRIVVEDFSYSVDELFYLNALNAGVLVAIEDGTDDGDENIDTYLIPTWGEETVLDVLARYFPHTTDADGNLIAIWTPEYRADTPSWCNEPNRVGTTLWCKHALSTADWWNVYLDGLGDGSEGFQDTPAAPGSVALFRFNKDSDLDGYSDRSEIRLGTDPNDPADHPEPELIAGVHSIRSGDQVVATLSLLNTGFYDAYGVEAVMIAPDDSVSITNNTVGGSGRVRALKQVIVGSRILLETPLPDPWTQEGHAVPAAAGYYTDTEDRTYTFTVQCGEAGGCEVGSGTWTLDWDDGAGDSGSLDFGDGYASPTFLDVGTFGVKLALYSGQVGDGDTFTVEARTPRDTFQYTINREPYTEPVVIVSYNDPQGNHRFVIPPEAMSLSHPTDNLATYAEQMLPDVGVEIVTTAEFSPGANTTNLVINNPTEAILTDAHLFLEFIDITGTVASEVPVTVALPAGPTVVPVAWDTLDFDPPYDENQDYIVMAFWTDYQGNILDTAARPLSSFQADPKPTFATDEAALTWDFGTVIQGEVLNHPIPLANIGFGDLLTHVSESVSAARHWVGFTNANYVREIVIEGDYLWAATSGGVLARHLTDGSYVKFTTTDDRLADNDVLSVLIDRAGYKWLGTYSGVSVLDDGGSPLDKSDDTWTTLTTTDGLVGTRAWEIVIDGAGRKWFAADSGVSVLDDNGTPLDKSDDQWQSFTTADGLACSDRGQAITIDGAGRKWIGCGWDGVSVLDDNGTPFDKSDDQWQSFGSADGMGSTLISSIAMDGAGRKWIGAWSSPGGVSVLDDNDTPFNKADDQWQTFFSADSGLAGDGVRSVVVDGVGYKWFGTNDGVSILDDNSTPLNKADDTWITFTTADGLANDTANDIVIDGSARKLFGTEGGGVSRLDDNGTPFNKADDQWQTLAITDGLASNRINTLIIDGPGHKWFGTYGGGANVLDDNGTPSNKADDQWGTFTADDGLPSDIVYAIAMDGAGRKWFGGHDYQVSVLDDNGTPFNKTDDQWQSFTTTDGLGGITNDIVVDGAGCKWFGTWWGGMSVLDDNDTPFSKADDQWISFTTADGLAHDLVGVILIDGAGRKWIGTDSGVSVLDDNGTPFNKADDQWTTFTTTDGLVHNVVGSIAIDGAGRKWLGTSIETHASGGGVSVLDDNGTPFNKADDQWQSFTTADGLANNNINAILIDQAGRKWFETRHGVSVLDDNGTPFNKADDTWTTYTTVNGLTSNSVSSAVIDGADNKWFGTGGGVSVLLDSQSPGTSDTRTQANRLPPADMATYTITVDTGVLPTGLYTGTAAIRTSDPANPTRTVHVTGTIQTVSGEAYVYTADPYHPWDEMVYIPAPHEANGVITFNHTITPDGHAAHPLLVYKEDDTLLGYGAEIAPIVHVGFDLPIQNSGFETGNFSGWTIEEEGDGWTITSQYVHSGLYAATQASDGGGGILRQDFDVSAWRDWIDNGYGSASIGMYSRTDRREYDGGGTRLSLEFIQDGQTLEVYEDGCVAHVWNFYSTWNNKLVPPGTDTIRAHYGICGGWTQMDDAWAQVGFDYPDHTIEKISDSLVQLEFPTDDPPHSHYRVQYGLKGEYTAGGDQLFQVRLPKRLYGNATLDVMLEEAGESSVQIDLDVGNDGTTDWTYSGTPNVPIVLGTSDFTGDLVGGLNTTWRAWPTHTASMVIIPINVHFNTSGELFLTNFVVTHTSDVDVTLTADDISFGEPVAFSANLANGTPTEGQLVPVQAMLHNTGGADSGPLTVAFFATPPDGFGGTYIGSDFVPNVSAGLTITATIPWNTLGFTGDVPVRVVADPYDRVAETDDDNNEATASLTILTRPDLHVTAVELSDDEPVVGETVTVSVTLRNGGQTAVGTSTLAFYDGNPDTDGTLLGEDTPAVGGESQTTLDFTWTPTAPGPHRLFAVSDRDDAVNEFDEGNNQSWQDVYVGFAGPLLLDSGNLSADPVYTTTLGYGVVDEGAADALENCGSEPHQTYRRDPSNRVVYRFDHLLPGHFYHLDVTLFNCPAQPRRLETVLVDDIAVAGPIDLKDDGEVHYSSTLLDPALYANRTISVTIQSSGSGAVVSEVNLHDIDYRYVDAGGDNDLRYTTERGYGYLDEDSTDQTIYGSLPYQSYREDQGDTELRYQFDGLDPAKRYLIHLTFYQASPFTITQQVAIDSVDTGLIVEAGPGQILTPIISVPLGTYQGDGRIVVRVIRPEAGAFVNEVALEELTQGTLEETQTINLHIGWNWFSFALDPKIERDTTCSSVTPTSAFSSFAGDVLIDEQQAPVGTLVEAYSPRGDKVGCETVTTAGIYPFMRVYGEEGPLPGMRAGEPVLFQVNGVPATITSGSSIWQNDRDTHIVDLAASSLAPVEKALESIEGSYSKLLCPEGTYCPLPANPVFNSCHTMQPGLGYLIYMTEPATLVIRGTRVPADTPLELEQEWNLIGYLPECSLAIETALASIDGQFDLLHGEDGTYRPPPNDSHNNLHQMGPGRGYWIRMTEAATLTYPPSACGVTAVQTFEVSETSKVSSCDAIPTPYFTTFYGTVMLGNRPYPAGAWIEALSPRGEVVGCSQIVEEGGYQFLRVYGADEDMGIPGMQAGEPVAFRVNGQMVELDNPPYWQNDRDVHELDLRIEPIWLYLPLVGQ